MANYEGEQCPKCKKIFQAGDDIVVCPDCGAPYHRSCSKEMEACVYADRHGTAEAYQPKAQREAAQAREQAKKVDGREQLRCSRCGTLNASDGLFCAVCGTPLKKQVDRQQQQVESGEPYGQPYDSVPPFSRIPYNPYTTPFGGLHPDEEIDGVAVKDLAIFLGQNAHYFLPRFKQMKEKNSNTWNWSAMFFTHYYLMFRKITWLGALMFAISLLLSVPAMFSYYDAMLHVYSPDVPAAFDEQMLFQMISVCNFLSIAIRVFLGMFTNRIYMNQVLRKIRKIRQEKDGHPDYHSALVKNGTVSFPLAIAIFAATIVMSFVSVFVMMALMI